jgi:hypothetical protein
VDDDNDLLGGRYGMPRLTRFTHTTDAPPDRVELLIQRRERGLDLFTGQPRPRPQKAAARRPQPEPEPPPDPSEEADSAYALFLASLRDASREIEHDDE